MPQPPQTHIPPLVRADSIPEEVDLLDEEMSTTQSGEPVDTHTLALEPGSTGTSK